MGVFEREFVSARGRALKHRDQHRRPMSPTCPMHLRRVCGTCEAFPVGADMRSEGQICARLQKTVDGTQCAAACNLWSRKSVRLDQIKTTQ